ncbi:MAG: DNA repair protein RecN [Lachnospiraceae bacterium]|nr:DNA repair protein RecN [Lachnospiraceae bacterium]
MLQSLHVNNLALIDELDVEFTDGLNILSGETGAGKSIILGSIGFCLGEKINKDMIKEDAPFSFAELVFTIDNEFVRKELEKLDIYPYDDQIIINRKITGGRSVAKINAETVPVTMLKQVAEILINIHGQNESHILQNTKNHLNILDDYGSDTIGDLLYDMESDFSNYKSKKSIVDELNSDLNDREREISFLEFETEEITNANLIKNEDIELEEEYKKLKNWQKIFDGLNKAYDETGAMSGSAADRISYAIKELSAINGYDEKAGNLYNILTDVENLLSDFNREVSSYIEDSTFDERKFVEIEDRLNLINKLKSKYGDSIDKILESLAEKEERLDTLRNIDEKLREAELDLDSASKKMKKTADILHEKRVFVAERFKKELTEALLDLNFQSVEFEVRISVNDKCSASGYDYVEFYISTNTGEKVRPLNKVASGGELSRIMLAIKTLQAAKDETQTMIFDEIDAGISGRTAQKVSECLNILAKDHQIICITHLPQIAAMEDSHFMIEKKVIDGHSKTTIVQLDEKSSIMELARMLGGSSVSDAAVNNAKELKEMALQFKKRGN